MVHIAIIMDGNGRWAKEKASSRLEGHEAGLQTFQTIVRHAALSTPIQFLTVYAFSVQNWARPVSEIKGLFRLANQYFSDLNFFKTLNVRLRIQGSLDLYPKAIQETIQKAVSETSVNTGLTVTVALSYGGREEIVEVAQKLRGRNTDECITQEMFEACLNPDKIPDPDLIIRTSGEFRVSNFLLWQSAYSEYLILEKFWPDFTPADLDSALQVLETRERRFGKLSSQIEQTSWPNESETLTLFASALQGSKNLTHFSSLHKYSTNVILKAKYYQNYQQVCTQEVSENYQTLTESFLLSVPTLSPETHSWISWLIFSAWLQNRYSLQPSTIKAIFSENRNVLDRYRQIKASIKPDEQIEEDLKERLISLSDYHREVYVKLETVKRDNHILGTFYALYPIFSGQITTQQICWVSLLVNVLFWPVEGYPTPEQCIEFILQTEGPTNVAMYAKLKTALLYLYIFTGTNIRTLHWSHVLRYVQCSLDS